VRREPIVEGWLAVTECTGSPGDAIGAEVIANTRAVEQRVQTGMRIERHLLKVLKVWLSNSTCRSAI
jgi:hypothetical protein